MNTRWITYEHIWARNLIFATLLFGLLALQNKFQPDIKGLPQPSDFDQAWQFLLLYTTIFAYNYWVVAKLLLARKYFFYAVCTLAYVLVMSFAVAFIDEYYGVHTPLIGELVSSISLLIISTAIYFTHIWILQNINRAKIDLLNREGELNFLKQQLSPHFLFNAINNLYGTALAAPEIITDKILELSDLLRYQIESTTKSEVSVMEERTFINNYINYTTYKSHDLHIRNETLGTIVAYTLPPLLFLPLMENAVKYSSETEQPFIHIQWTFEPNTLIFRIENSYLPVGSKIKGTKVGLENLQKRLSLLNVKHTLHVSQALPNVYKIELKLWELAISA